MYVHHTYWLFLLASAALFWATPRRFRAALLAVLSIGYIASQDATAAVAGLVTVAIVHIALSRVRATAKGGEIVAVLLAGGLIAHLIYRKFPHLASAGGTGVVAATVVVPLGLSFLTFKMIDFVARTVKGELPHQPLDRTLLYFFLFPIFPAGPMPRVDEFYRKREETWNRDAWVEGLTRIVQGLVKKFALADAVVLAFLHRTGDGSTMAARMAGEPTLWAWADILVLQVYLYLDFSAYSDLAIGGARLFGFRIPENFRYPLFAVNIGEFWKRWHITLAGLCQTYIYRPVLAHSRSVLLAMTVTMLVIALWHGMTLGWLLWGAYHAAGLCLYAAYRRRVGPPPERPGRIRGLAAWAGTMMFVSSACAFLVSMEPSGWRVGFQILQNLVGL